MTRLAAAIGRALTPSRQRVVGLLMILVSVPLAAYGPFTDEPLLVYEMSAAALTFAGLSTIVAALPSEEEN